MGELEPRLPQELRWIGAMCSSAYFKPCERHEPAGGKEKEKAELTNFFARDTGETLCPSCVGGRDVVQIRRSSYHNVVRVRDVCRLFDARAIQTYVINGARVVFLNARPHPRGRRPGGTGDAKAPSSARGDGRRSSCRRCSRTLQSDASQYCSIACKAAVAGAAMAPSEAAAREAEAESGGDGGDEKAKETLREKRPSSGKKREREDGADADGNDDGGSASPRTPSVPGRARAAKRAKSARSASGRRGSFGTTPRDGRDVPSRESRRSELSARSPTDAHVSSTPVRDASPVKRETDTLPRRETRFPRERASPLGFPDLEASPDVGAARSGAIRISGLRDAEKTPAKEKKETLAARTVATKPPAVVSNSRRKNRPKRSPDA